MFVKISQVSADKGWLSTQKLFQIRAFLIRSDLRTKSKTSWHHNHVYIYCTLMQTRLSANQNSHTILVIL